MSKPTLTYPVLCLVTDPEVPDLMARVEAALSAGVNMLQLRGHTLSAAELYRLALALRPLCHRYQAVFIINDRIDVGLVTGVDGFQLGARSLPVTVARQLIGDDYLLGVSVHSSEEALAARAHGADFLLAGTIFASHTHPNEQPCGTDLLYAIRKRTGTVGIVPCADPRPHADPPPYCPLLAIGGITQENASKVMQAGADGIAVITAILSSANVKQAVNELRTAMFQSHFNPQQEETYERNS